MKVQETICGTQQETNPKPGMVLGMIRLSESTGSQGKMGGADMSRSRPKGSEGEAHEVPEAPKRIRRPRLFSQRE